MTQAFRARLVELRNEGFSYSRMAAALSQEFGTKLTRNAVAGAVSRAGLPKLPPRPPKPKRTRKRSFLPKRPTAPSIARTKPINPVSAAARFALTLADQAIPVEQRRTLETVQAGNCRWIVGDPRSANWFFCGAAVANGKSFCGPHCTRAWEARR